ncbi:MAG: pyridoxamine 5'-phosphate oxidase family protein [Solirubrobacterales bacterium]
MARKRDQIKMSEPELGAFLASERVVSVSTNGRDGWPHVMALWYVMRDGEPWIYTYAASQKVRNLERDDRATLMIETGNEYQELRGVMLKTHAEIHRELDEVAPVAEELFAKYQGGTEVDAATRDALRAQAAKRVAIRFRVSETTSWDHSKLGGTY